LLQFARVAEFLLDGALAAALVYEIPLDRVDD
jgi:hypothetical protein